MTTREELEKMSEEDLDEAVHEAKAAEAAEINNGGKEAQIAYLLEAESKREKAPQRLEKVEVVFLDENRGWDTMLVDIPKEVADTESEDAFLAWAYGREGEKFRASWHRDVIAVHVMSWRGDLQDHPGLEDEALLGRDQNGVWQRFERTGDPNEADDAIFEVWDQGERQISVGDTDLSLYSEAEADAHYDKLVEKFRHPSTTNISELSTEIASLREALNLGKDEGRVSGPATDVQNLPRWKDKKLYRLLIDIDGPDSGPRMSKGALVEEIGRTGINITIQSTLTYSEGKVGGVPVMAHSTATVDLTDVLPIFLGELTYDAWLSLADSRESADRRTVVEALRLSGLVAPQYMAWTAAERAEYLAKYYGGHGVPNSF